MLIFSRLMLSQNFPYGIILSFLWGETMEFDRLAFGNRLLEARKNADLKQTDISNKLGISQPAYSNYETGTTDVPLSALYNIASILDVSVLWLMGIDNGEFSPEEMLLIDNFKKYVKSIRKYKK